MLLPFFLRRVFASDGRARRHAPDNGFGKTSGTRSTLFSQLSLQRVAHQRTVFVQYVGRNPPSTCWKNIDKHGKHRDI